MSEPARTRALLPRDAALLLIWPLLIAALTAQLVFSVDVEWPMALRSTLYDWLPWVVLSVPVWLLARRFPLERGRLHVSVPVHVLACALAIAAAGWMSETLGPRPPLRRPDPAAIARGEARRLEREGSAAPHLMPGQMPPPGRVRAEQAQRRMGNLLLWSRSKLDLPVYWIVVTVAHALAFYRRAEERTRRNLELEAGLSQAKLEALRLQLQPHFLFNTLHAISTLVHRDAEAADEMIANLSELLRLSLETKDQEVPLSRELELLDHYLAIEQVRLGDRLRVDRSIEAAALEALVPALILQPIVENAVRHGLEPRSQPGLIRLVATCRDERLFLTVEDNGLGLQPADRRSERRGIGLANSEARLRELHGDAARLILREPPEGGVSVHLELPLRRGPVGAKPTRP